LFGRLETGETFAVIEKRWSPSFHVREEDVGRAREILGAGTAEWTTVPSDKRSMDGAAMAKIETKGSADSQRLGEELHRMGVRTYEADVKLASRFLMDLGIHGTVGLEGAWKKGRRVGRIYTDPALTPSDHEPSLTILSLDIETDARGNTVFAAAFSFIDRRGGIEVDEVLLNGAGTEAARCFPGEEVMLSELRRRILDLDPDIITGWNVEDFDLRVLSRRFRALGIPFDIGRSDSSAVFLDREPADGGTRWKRSKAIVPGRQVLDGLWLARLAGMGLEDYRLETVARSVLGRGKRIEERPGETRTAAVERLYREDPGSLCAYCLEDARLALAILFKEGLIDIALRKSLLIGTPLDQTSMSVASFEFLYMEHLHKAGIVAPTLGVDQDPLERAPGGGIITSRAGLYANVLTFDFRSLYPSIIRTFNIDPLTMVRAPAAADPQSITAPNGARFSREPGTLPRILDRFFESREEARRRGDRRAVYAYKIVMNSFYGVLGTPGCRFASSALAGAITTFGQHILYWARDLIASKGYEVIYGDTDSLFVLSGVGRDERTTALMVLGNELTSFVNSRLAEYVRETWNVEPRLELEFETLYRRFFLPPVRTSGAAGPGADDLSEDAENRGRAKGYAGLRTVPGPGAGEVTELVEIVGMEAVRHDWTPLAQDLQRAILEQVFLDAPSEQIAELVRSCVRDLRAGNRDGALAYRKYLRKPVEAYTKSSPPHARAAALLPAEERMGLIRYVWTSEGPQPESRRTAPLDYEHYLQKQVRPIVESIAPYIGLRAADLLAPGGQLGLF
jgi:DNA polymerase-2